MTLGTLPFFLNPLANEDHRSQKPRDLERHTHSQTRVVQSHWSEIGIAKDFVRQLPKTSSIECRSSLIDKNGLGGSGTHDLRNCINGKKKKKKRGSALKQIIYYY